MTPDPSAPTTPAGDHPSPTSRVISLRLRGPQRRKVEEAVRAGTLTKVAAADVLAEETLPQVATQSVWLLVISAAVYALLLGLGRDLNHSGQLFGDGPLWNRIALLVVLNVAGYVVMVPAHEAVHALVILALGGRPRFGLRLPLAAYCTAPDQLFLRDGYIAVALAPLIALSVVAAAVAIVAPGIGAAMLLAVAGNVSGAVGDLMAVSGVRKQPSLTLIADTATGYIAYQLTE